MMPHPLDIKRNVDNKPPIFLSEESPTQVPRTPASTIKLLEDKLDYYMSTIPKKEQEKKILFSRCINLHNQWLIAFS